MPSPADRFTQLQKVALFLITLGEERARLLLASMELPTIERINQTIAALGPVTPAEKAAVMLEFADFFFEGKSLPTPLADPAVKKKAAPHRLYGKRLYVRVNDSMWAHELTLTYRSKILALLQDRVGKENLEDVHFAVKQW